MRTLGCAGQGEGAGAHLLIGSTGEHHRGWGAPGQCTRVGGGEERRKGSPSLPRRRPPS